MFVEISILIFLIVACGLMLKAFDVPFYVHYDYEKSPWIVQILLLLSQRNFSEESFQLEKVLTRDVPLGIVWLFLFPFLTVISLGNDLRYTLEKLWSIPPDVQESSDQPTEGLILFVHGLKTGGQPSTQVQYLEKPIREKFPGYTFLAPQVPYGGNCSVDTATEPILEMVREYTKNNPGKPVVLIGVSNGGRIVFNIANRIDLSAQDTLVLTIAGALYGSPLAFIANRSSCLKRILTSLDPVFLKELEYGSQKCQSLIKTAQDRFNTRGDKRLNYVAFGVAFDDNLIYSRSAFPRLPNIETYVFYGESHRSIVPACVPLLLKVLTKWNKN